PHPRRQQHTLPASNLMAVRAHPLDSKNLNFASPSQTPQPLPRTEQPGLIRNRPGVEQRPKLDLHKSGVVDVFVELPIRQKIPSAERGVALSIFKRSFVPTQPQIVIALDPKLEEFVERGVTGQNTGSNRATH